jgi:CheY-like chemotaxis protein
MRSITCATAPKRWTTCIGVAISRDETNGQPALVLLDLKMPRVDGFEVLRQIKRDLDLKMIPVVMMTSSREERDLLVTYQTGSMPTWSSRSSFTNSLRP